MFRRLWCRIFHQNIRSFPLINDARWTICEKCQHGWRITPAQ
jgi:hypothetical protein